MKQLSICAALAVLALLAGPARAEESTQSDAQAPSKEPSKEPKLDPTHGPAKVKIGAVADLDLPGDTLFFGQKDTRTLLERMGNITSGTELGLVWPEVEGEDWFVVFEYDDSGYIKNAAKEKIDADALLKSIEEGNEHANEERKKRGESALHVTGWAEPPHYDPQTQNLTWATYYQTDDGHKGLNYNVRLLGRTGVMSVTLVDSPDKLAISKPRVDKLLAAYGFTRGHRYAEWRSGDKVAQYGLAALVAGGAAAAGAKLGLFAFLGKIFAKLGKLLIVVFAAIAGAVAKFWNALRGKFTGRKKAQDRSDFLDPGAGQGPGPGGQG